MCVQYCTYVQEKYLEAYHTGYLITQVCRRPDFKIVSCLVVAIALTAKYWLCENPPNDQFESTIGSIERFGWVSE
jgi:hypothetical protein